MKALNIEIIHYRLDNLILKVMMTHIYCTLHPHIKIEMSAKLHRQFYQSRSV